MTAEGKVDYTRARIREAAHLRELMYRRFEHYKYTLANAASYAVSDKTVPLQKRLDYIEFAQGTTYSAATSMLQAIYWLEMEDLGHEHDLLHTIKEWILNDQETEEVEVDDEDENNFDRYNFENL